MSSNQPPPPGGPPPQGPPPGGGYPPQGPPPGGGYPPQGPPGGYPPQGPPGGYPPQGPPGGYPPQGPPPGGPPGYGYGSPQPRPFSVGDAFNYGWTKFQQNAGTIILAALAWLGILLLIGVVWFFALGAIGLGFGGDIETNAQGEVTSGEGGFVAIMAASGLFALVMMLFGFVLQAGIIRGALHITYGRELRVGTTFSFANLGTIIVAALIIAVLSAIGFALCYLPGLIVIFFTQFTMFFIVDKNMGAIDAIKASASFVNRNLATMVILYIACAIAYFIGMIACYVGLLLALPVVIIAQTYAYRVLQGEAVAP